MEFVRQPLAPVYNSQSRILILGSFPSIKSREQGFYYGNPQNRFWKVLSALLNEPEPVAIEAKRRLLLKHKIALWDVIESCRIEGSDDNSICDVVPADIGKLIENSSIRKVYTNGGKAFTLYQRYCEKSTRIPAAKLPSTSPANAAWSLEKLIADWRGVFADDLACN